MRLLLIGIVFIIGGLSGGMVLRGTSSGLALAALGVGLCIWGGIQMMNSPKSGKQLPRRSALNRRPGAIPGRKPPARRPPSARPGAGGGS